jgi:hypothetical protein
MSYIDFNVSQDGLLGTATGYGLDGRGSIPGRSKRFFSIPQRSDLALGPTQPLIQWAPGAFPGVKLTTHLHLVPG